MHPRNFGSERIVCTYYDVQKSVLHVQIRPIDLSITYNQPRVTSGYKRFAWVIWNTSDGIIITVPNIKYLKSRFFLSFMYNTLTFYNTPTGYIT